MKTQSRNEKLESVAIEWLTLLRSSAITAQQQEQFFEWLQADPENQQAFVAVDAMWQRGAALSQVKRSKAQEPLNRFHTNFLWGGLTLAVCLLFAVVFFVLSPQAPLEYQIFETQVAERETFELEDGSRITLNASSQLSFAISKDKRSAELQRGEVFFDVSHDSERPFIIETDQGMVEVLGTQFSVDLSQSNAEVTVLEGRVRVTPSSKGHSQSQAQASSRELVANQKLIIANGNVQTQSVDAGRSLAWREGYLRFEGSPLSEVIENLSEYYQKSIVVKEDHLKAITVVAVLPLDKSLDQNLSMLTNSLDLTFQKVGGELHITLSDGGENE